MRGCAYTLCNWSRVNFLCLTMKNSFQRAGCEAHKSGSVRGVVGRPAIPTRQIPPAAMRQGFRRQPGCRRRGGLCLLFIHPPAHGSEVSPAARNTLDSARIPRASKLLICGLFLKGRVLAQDGVRKSKRDAVIQNTQDGLDISMPYVGCGD